MGLYENEATDKLKIIYHLGMSSGHSSETQTHPHRHEQQQQHHDITCEDYSLLGYIAV
jgi:hypothetical protein